MELGRGKGEGCMAPASQPKNYMRAAWWWIDRWRRSTAYTDMTAEEQGIYRNLLDEIWLREDHVIPDDDRILAKISGDPEAWTRCSGKVLRWMKRLPGGWTHVTALEVIAQSTKRAERQREYRNSMRNGDHNAGHNAGHNTAASPSPSPSLTNNDKQISSADADVQAVYDHWKERAKVEQRSSKVVQATRKRIAARLKEGFTVADLQRAVDVACWDEFYVKRGYYRQPDVIWRNAERVQSLLARAQHQAARPVPL